MVDETVRISFIRPSIYHHCKHRDMVYCTCVNAMRFELPCCQLFQRFLSPMDIYNMAVISFQPNQDRTDLYFIGISWSINLNKVFYAHPSILKDVNVVDMFEKYYISVLLYYTSLAIWKSFGRLHCILKISFGGLEIQMWNTYEVVYLGQTSQKRMFFRFDPFRQGLLEFTFLRLNQQQ